MGLINIFDFTQLFTKKSLHASGVALDFFAKVKLKVDGMCHILAAKLSNLFSFNAFAFVFAYKTQENWSGQRAQIQEPVQC